MAHDLTGLSEGDGIALLAAATLFMGCVAASCSSPQTAEINANKRQHTLMKYVHIGMVEGAFLVGVAAMVSKRPGPILIGGALAGGGLYWQYRHALKAGLRNGGPGTED